jgi:integrase
MDARSKDGGPYQPRMSDEYWAVVRDFVSSVVQRTCDAVPYPEKTLFWTMSEFALWGWQDAALPLEDHELFDRDVISYYIQTGCNHLTPAARGNRRSILLRIAETLDVVGPGKLPALPPSDPSSPYSRREIVSIISWARTQSTRERRSSAHVLLALGLGAGLSAHEIIGLRDRDVQRDGAEIDVKVTTGRVRQIPMLASFAPLLPKRIPGTEPDQFCFRPGRTQTYVNAISNFVRRGHTGGAEPQSQRMRATWIVHHLNANTPLTVLTAAAGLESLDALARFERFIRRVDDEQSARLLRYAEPAE